MNFPTLDLYSNISKYEMWKNFIDFKPCIKNEKFFIDSYNKSNNGFNPMPPKFMNKFVLIDSSDVDYFKIDGITDFYTELQRMHAKKFYRDQTPWEMWSSTGYELQDLPKESIKAFRDTIYKTHSEATLFRPSWAKGVLSKLFETLKSHPKYENMTTSEVKVHDISSGWGDRLLAAIAMGMQYQGYDPNINLKPGHDAIIKDFGDNTMHNVSYEPYELNKSNKKCHIVFSSPPFYKLEVYNGPGQSIDAYPEFEVWMKNFLLKSMELAWQSLENGGILAIHLCDYYDKEKKYNMIQQVLNYVIMFDGASWLGVIGIKGERGKTWPIWCWRKD